MTDTYTTADTYTMRDIRHMLSNHVADRLSDGYDLVDEDACHGYAALYELHAEGEDTKLRYVLKRGYDPDTCVSTVTLRELRMPLEAVFEAHGAKLLRETTFTGDGSRYEITSSWNAGSLMMATQTA